MDEKFMQRCITLSEKALEKGDQPFGSIVVCGDEIIAEGTNDSAKKVSDHAEILALDEAHKKKGDLSECTLYTNVEPCPMCAFMIREYKIKKVVYALSNPVAGGCSRWNILGDETLSDHSKWFTAPPKVKKGVLAEKAVAVFKKTPNWEDWEKVFARRP